MNHCAMTLKKILVKNCFRFEKKQVLELDVTKNSENRTDNEAMMKVKNGYNVLR